MCNKLLLDFDLIMILKVKLILKKIQKSLF
jgi:hypothetical protein